MAVLCLNQFYIRTRNLCSPKGIYKFLYTGRTCAFWPLYFQGSGSVYSSIVTLFNFALLSGALFCAVMSAIFTICFPSISAWLLPPEDDAKNEALAYIISLRDVYGGLWR